MLKRLIFLCAIFADCTNESDARSTLLDAGYRNVTITGFEFMCSKDDGTCTGFDAIGPTGRHVKGAVGCWYFLKGCTIRLSE